MYEKLIKIYVAHRSIYGHKALWNIQPPSIMKGLIFFLDVILNKLLSKQLLVIWEAMTLIVLLSTMFLDTSTQILDTS